MMRIMVGIIGIPLIIVLLLYGGILFTITTFVIAILGLLEFYAISRKKGMNPNIYIGVAATAFLYATLYYGNLSLYLPAASAIFVLITIMLQLWRKTDSALFDIVSTLSGVMYFPLLLFFLTKIYILTSPADGRYLTLILFISVWLCDSAAYFGGKFFGRRKLFERISPKKTWEGAGFGLFGSIFGFIVAGNVLMPEIHITHWFALGILTGVFGPIGDLAESLMKRDANIKDSSNILPGHGGVLDRFDSMTFAAPIMYFYAAYFI